MGTSEIIELTEDSNGPHSFSFNRLRVKVKPDSKDKQPMDQNLSKFTKNMYKAPMNNKPGPSKQSQIEITESVTLKQALRKLCITQASEMAAMKRSNKLIGLTDSGNIKRLYASVLIESSTEKNNNLVEISIFEDKPINPSELSKNKGEIKTEPKPVLNKIKTGSNRSVSPANKTPKMRIQDVINQDSKESTKKDKKGKTVSKSSDPSTHLATPRLVKPIFRNKTTVKKKIKPEPSTIIPNPPKTPKPLKSNNPNSPKNPKPLKSNPNHPNSTPTKPANPIESKKPIESATPKAALERKEKGEWSQSSKSSMGDYSNSSSTTSLSEDSHTGSGHKTRPHMSKDFRWVAIKRAIMQNGPLTLDNFKLIKRLGCGDIGTVYLAELAGSDCLFALKVMDVDFLVSRKKMLRAQTEREILQMLDHPFLPTLYSHFITDNLACLVMEFCPGGDLHVLRQKQPTRCFSEPAARFYVAEVLLALEYLHMLGVIYRDLKPENILVREDGHIMLSDFDLSLRCSVSPTLLKSDPSGRDDPAKSFSLPCSENNCMNMDPICLKPVSCFTPRLVSHSARNNRSKFDSANQNGSLPQLVVEPTDARSNSFVGTHEYLAPEIIRGDGHGSSVDWWTLGVFLYELLYGKTPFKGPGNDETLSNVISQNLKFGEGQNVSFHAKDLIRGLLVKDPEMRMGSVRGAAEIKNHPFFDGLNWALIRCAIPPETPRDLGSFVAKKNKKESGSGGKCLDFGMSGDNIEFELF